MPPARTGIAADSVVAVAALRRSHEIDVYADDTAHDFLWRHQRQPYDLTVYQLGNSSSHDFLWPYLFRHPGLAVLHDAHLHHSRAAALLRDERTGAYRDEFAANHPDVSPEAAELAVKGFDSFLYYMWPMTRLIVEASRLTAVHARLSLEGLREASPRAALDTIRLGHGRRVSAERIAAARRRVRTRYGIPDTSVLFAVCGGLTPEKRLPQVLKAFAALLPYEPDVHLLLAGAPAGHYDLAADVERLGLSAAVSITGYLEDEEAFTDAVAACDVSLNLRWPTAREVSGPWLRALAAGKPTVTLDLAHMADVPSLDPRTWTIAHAGSSPDAAPEPVTVAVDLLDEDHSLRLAMRRLAADADLRARLGRAASAHWETWHSTDGMIADYERVIARALEATVPAADLPAHLRADGSARLRALIAPFDSPVVRLAHGRPSLGIGADLWDTI
jgi:glycosyltransferase involved in cell wall biosynthesis